MRRGGLLALAAFLLAGCALWYDPAQDRTAACRRSAKEGAHLRVTEPADSRCSGGAASAEYVEQIDREEARLFAECMGASR